MYSNNNKPKHLDVAYVVIRDILKNWVAIVCIALSAAIFAYISAAICYVPKYTSRCTIIISAKVNNTGVYTDTTETEKLTDTITAVFSSTVLKKKTAQSLGMDKFDGTIKISVVPTTNLLEVSVNSSSPHNAFRLLKSLLEIYPTISADILGDIVMEIYEEPTLPSAPSNPFRFSKNISLSVLFSISAVVLIASLYSYFTDTIKNEWDAAEKLDAKSLGIVYHEARFKNIKARIMRKKKRLLIGAPSVSFGFSETIKKIRTNINYYREKNGGKIMLITSYNQGEGKTLIAANLAQATIQRNQKALLISGINSSAPLLDLFNITLPQEFINKNKTTLDDYVYTENDSRLSILINTFDELLSAGLSDFIASDKFHSFIKKSAEIYDLIIIDGPCVSNSSNTEVFAKMADFSLLVVQQNRTKTPLLNDTIDTLNKYNKGLAGFVFNNVHSSATIINIGYGYGYGRKVDYGYGNYGKYGRYGSYANHNKYSNYGNYARRSFSFPQGKHETAKRDK